MEGRAESKFRYYFKQYTYYGIIAILVVVALVFLPMLDTSGEMGFEQPETTLSWVFYIVVRTMVGIITFLIFVSFDEQGKVNILNDARYVKAYNKLYSTKDKHYIPLSPAKYKVRTRGIKGVSISFTMVFFAFFVCEAVLTYNYSVLLAYGLTVIMSVISGIFQMNKASDYWVEEFPLWVDYYIEKIKEESQDDNSRWERIEESRGTSSEEQE